MKIELLDIIRTGRFDNITIGDIKENVLHEIGEPQHTNVWNTDPKEYSETCCYKWFEFTFINGVLHRYQHKYLLDSDYQFNREFLSGYNHFKINTWFKHIETDIKLAQVKQKLVQEQITFIEEPFYDTLRLLINIENKITVELQFHSKLAYQCSPEEWQDYDEKALNWKLGALYVTGK